ncbi:inter-alpha-trypsin inhibitor heavy chain H3 [Patella vulgata]|uniref:inter-alpha-trypsin inhibitor heavy chain H3 n=1 Tax=Patella vulgata TaxID=6465 RepID=UPI0021809089|nr:inter-alpha-trypsin inhibitor heavy chain H3 [Patella vulgata]
MARLKIVYFSALLFISILSGEAQDNGTGDEGPTIYSLHILSDIKFRFATTLITSRIANPANTTRETVFDVDIPSSAFISNFTMDIGGNIYYGKVKDRKSAQKEYDRHIEEGKTAGHISVKPNEFNKFKVAVAVAPESKVTFNLTYQEVLERRLGSYEHEIYINPRQPVRDLQVKVSIQEVRDLKYVSIPPITNDVMSIETKGKNQLTTIDRPTSKSALINFTPSTTQQGENGVAGKFVVHYDVERDFSGGEAYVLDGYFIHFFAPMIEEEFPRDILFLLDISASMSDYKLGQLKDAMRLIIGQLNEKDHFNMMTLQSSTKTWSTNLQQATKGVISKAQNYVRNLRTGGYTDLAKIIPHAIHYLKKQRGEGVPMIFFISDGIAQAHITSPKDILKEVDKVNKDKIPIYSMAVGAESDWNFMYRLSYNSGGLARRIFEDSRASSQMSGFYKEVSSALLQDITIKSINGSINNTITQNLNDDYISGTELVFAGQIDDTGTVLDIRANSINGPVDFTLQSDSPHSTMNSPVDLTSVASLGNIIERMWAFLFIKENLKAAVAEESASERNMNYDRVRMLAQKYGFVTPVTSMVVGSNLDGAWKAYEEDMNELQARTPAPTPKPRPTRPPPPPRYWGGGGGGGWGGGGGDPHFMIGINGLDFPFCFDIGNKDEIYTLFHDPFSGITVNVKLKSGVKLTTRGTKRVYIKETAIIIDDQKFFITHDVIHSHDADYQWKTKLEIRVKRAWLIIDPRKELVRFMFDKGIEVEVLRRTHNEHTRIGDDYINVEIRHEGHASSSSTGIIGQFHNRSMSLRRIKVTEADTLVGLLELKKDKSMLAAAVATLVNRSDPVQKKHGECWRLRHKGIEAFVHPTDFLVDDIFYVK